MARAEPSDRVAAADVRDAAAAESEGSTHAIGHGGVHGAGAVGEDDLAGDPADRPGVAVGGGAIRRRRSTAPASDPWPHTVHFVPESAGALAVSMGAAVVTINHPLGLAAILSGTPVLHMAQTPYGIPGVATRTDGPQLADDLRTALTDEDQPTLRRRFLTRILKEHHIWCAPNAPDSNGVAGLVRWIETAIDSPKLQGRPTRYRPGPVWPLAVGSPRRRRKP